VNHESAGLELGSIIAAELGAAHIPGCSVGVVDRSGHTNALAVGMADMRCGREATPNSVYHLYSGTKVYTATAVLQLAEAGRLGLDASAATYLPDVMDSCRATVRQLLNHTSGLRDTLRAFLSVHSAGMPPLTTAGALSRYRIRADRAPGERVQYRNINYALLGEIVSRVSAQPFTDYVAEHILARLAMPVMFTTADAMRPNAATGYIGAYEPLRFVAPLLMPAMRGHLFGKRVDGLLEVRPVDLDTAAVGGLVGSVLGFLPFVRAHLHGGGPILHEATVREMQRLSARGAAGIMSRVGMGLGWKIGEVDRVAFLNHEGGGPGFTSETRLYPDVGVGIVVCMNRWIMPRRSHLVAHRICEAIRSAYSA